jgi:CoA:oxalate CoA-transferase
MPGPLEGIKVLSFGRMLSGPYATMLLGDLGAEVIKVEVPQTGDLARHSGPFIDKISSYFLSINRGKKSITLDLKKKAAKDIVFKLSKQVDILLENFRPGVMDKLGLGYKAISEQNPGIIYASLSGFGQTGPYANKPAFDMIAQGMGGVVSITGEPQRPPVRVGYSIGDMGASLFTAVAILAALHERQHSGKGQWIDVSMLDSQVALGENAFARYFASGEVPQPLGSRHPLFTPFQVFPTGNGHIVLIAFHDDKWEAFCNAADKMEWITDDRFKSNAARLKNYDAYLHEMNTILKTKTSEQWMELFEAHNIMHGPVNTIEQVVNDPHVRHRDMIREVNHASAGKLDVVGTPMKFSRTPCTIDKPSPELGEQTEDILRDELGLSEEEIEQLKESKVI